jgi:hypothetical protein
VVKKMALREVSVRVLRFSPASIIPPLLHVCLHVAFTRKNERSLGTLQKATPCQKSGSAGYKSASNLHFSKSYTTGVYVQGNWYNVEEEDCCVWLKIYPNLRDRASRIVKKNWQLLHLSSLPNLLDTSFK